jgi:hypothetical protein
MSSPDGTYNVALDLLDIGLDDLHGRRCGRIDDLELEQGAGGELTIAALLVGPGAWRSRLPAWLRWIARGPTTRIPWEAILEVETSVRLKEDARELGLDRGERRPAGWLWRIPGS